MPVTPAEAQQVRMQKIKQMYRRWLKDEAYLSSLVTRTEGEFSSVNEMLRNLGSAIAHAQREVAKLRSSTAP